MWTVFAKIGHSLDLRSVPLEKLAQGVDVLVAQPGDQRLVGQVGLLERGRHRSRGNGGHNG
jgi:hypothetical protein